MTASGGLQAAMNQLASRGRGDDYSKSVLADVATQAAATNTTYNRNVYNFYYASEVPGIKLYTVGFHNATAGSPGWSSDGGTTVDVSVVQAGIDAYSGSGRPLMLDIETWAPRGATLDDAIANISLVAGMWKDQTDRTLALYSWVPYSNYAEITALYTAITTPNAVTEQLYRARISRDMHLNDYVMGELGGYFDWLVPRCYVAAHDSIAMWKYYAAYSILEAIRLAGTTHDVYPIWYYQATTLGEDLAEAEFLSATKFVAAFPGITGSIAWSSASQPDYWAGHLADLISGNAEGDFPDPA